MVNSAKRVIEVSKEEEMEAEMIHKIVLLQYKKFTDKIREIVGNKVFDETILGNISANNYSQTP